MKANSFFETPVTAHPKTSLRISEDLIPQQYVLAPSKLADLGLGEGKTVNYRTD
jgi:hypothetical protein